ncbi:phosphoribosylamine--glycine ligase [Falsiroseomonas tokyonensis]|uniref:Phosphoribosylamine--glycine ligase n=1 Tax=Falsiroseomonas tokyonensis TaxID=430521 RepID=A0ABV7BPZ1_9PROT|nr:phosphoribosylamine--glycine ligase [Falsiroseomonas tokyonensis]MBU8536538.1 phosphoribosylamine--glycine ligase [Falsiroseomonas tokyonensis]
MKPFLSSLAAILLLAGCGGRAAPGPAASANSPAHAECRAEAQRAPAVADLSRRVVIGLPYSEDQLNQARQEAEGRAFTDCLRRRGLVRGGGVEPLRRSAL